MARNSQKARSTRGRRIWLAVLGTVLLLVSILCLVLSALSMFNWSAQNSYSTAATHLSRNIAAAKDGSKNVADLQASQQEVNAALSDLSSSKAVQVPQLSQAVTTATRTSHRLDRILLAMKSGKNWRDAQRQASQKQPTRPKAQRQRQNGSSQTPQALQQQQRQQQQQQEQKQKLDKLISRTRASTNSTLKPW